MLTPSPPPMGASPVLTDARAGGEGGGSNFSALWGLSRFGEMEAHFSREPVQRGPVGSWCPQKGLRKSSLNVRRVSPPSALATPWDHLSGRKTPATLGVGLRSPRVSATLS